MKDPGGAARVLRFKIAIGSPADAIIVWLPGKPHPGSFGSALLGASVSEGISSVGCGAKAKRTGEL